MEDWQAFGAANLVVISENQLSVQIWLHSRLSSSMKHNVNGI